MNLQENENGECDFSIELTCKRHRLSVLSTDVNDGVLIEGTLGRLQRASFIESDILELKGCYGIMRVHLKRNEISVPDSENKCAGGDSGCN